jgi:hypothetical protein
MQHATATPAALVALAPGVYASHPAFIPMAQAREPQPGYSLVAAGRVHDVEQRLTRTIAVQIFQEEVGEAAAVGIG